MAEFGDAGVETVFQDLSGRTCPQRDGRLTTHLSVIDAPMNVGPAAGRTTTKEAAE